MKQFGWKKKIGYLLCLAVVVIGLCSMAWPKEVQASDLSGASHSVSEDDITVTITTDKQSYKSGEEIHFEITVNNDKRFWVSHLEQ